MPCHGTDDTALEPSLYITCKLCSQQPYSSIRWGAPAYVHVLVYTTCRAGYKVLSYWQLLITIVFQHKEVDSSYKNWNFPTFQRAFPISLVYITTSSEFVHLLLFRTYLRSGTRKSKAYFTIISVFFFSMLLNVCKRNQLSRIRHKKDMIFFVWSNQNILYKQESLVIWSIFLNCLIALKQKI